MSVLKEIAIYPYAEQENPRARGYTTPNGKHWLAAQPRGMEYWERLADVLNREPVAERDRFFMAMLKDLGIEKGKAWFPYFRFYSPKQAFLDRTWILPDIEKVK